MDNGPEFVAKIASEWSQMQEIDFQYIQPGKPTQNAFIERFNGTLQKTAILSHPQRIKVSIARRMKLSHLQRTKVSH